MTERAKEREKYKKRKRELQTEVPKLKSKKPKGNFCIESKITLKKNIIPKWKGKIEHDWEVEKRGYKTKEVAGKVMGLLITKFKKYSMFDDCIVEFRIKEK